MLTKYLSVFLISMVPLIELRGAIPVGVAMGLPLWQVYVIAIIGNMLPVPFIFFFARKVLEWGADGVVIPHCKTPEMARKCVEAAKFSPMGRRGGETNVRAAGFGYHNFDWNRYMAEQNANTLVIPMDEDYEFTDNLDEILNVEGVDAVNFGPIDYAVSKNLKVGYAMGEEVHDAFKALVKKAREKGVGVLGPVVPPTKENLENAIEDGYNMIIVGNDMWHFQNALKAMMKDHVGPLQA